MVGNMVGVGGPTIRSGCLPITDSEVSVRYIEKPTGLKSWLFFKGPALKKKIIFFPSPAGMSLTELSLAGNNLIIPGQGEFGL